MLRRFNADLHVHTVLSPCADYRMVPELIVERAIEAGLDLLAVTDHNSGENAAEMVRAAMESGVAVLPGMEVETREGVHVVVLFDDVEALQCWQGTVYAALPARENDERVFGAQLVVDASGRLLGVNKRLLITSADISLEEVVARSGELGGVCVPAHVDRPAYGLLEVLGIPPPGLQCPALEISPLHTVAEAAALFPALVDRTLIRSSDAHRLEDIGRVSTPFLIADARVSEIALACRGENGRRVML